jgi:hypothetical protein
MQQCHPANADSPIRLGGQDRRRFITTASPPPTRSANATVPPRVLDAYRTGALLEAWQGTRSGARLTRSDHALLKVLATPA